MNHFFALEVPQEVQQYIQREVVPLWKPALRENVRWYEPEDYHVTLKFLGDVSEERRRDLVSTAVSVAAEALPFSLTLAPPGTFPSDRSKRVFWMGVGRSGPLSDLAAALDRACGELGFMRKDRLYTPHITLARISRGGGRESEGNGPLVCERLFPF